MNCYLRIHSHDWDPKIIICLWIYYIKHVKQRILRIRFDVDIYCIYNMYIFNVLWSVFQTEHIIESLAFDYKNTVHRYTHLLKIYIFHCHRHDRADRDVYCYECTIMNRDRNRDFIRARVKEPEFFAHVYYKHPLYMYLWKYSRVILTHAAWYVRVIMR